MAINILPHMKNSQMITKFNTYKMRGGGNPPRDASPSFPRWGSTPLTPPSFSEMGVERGFAPFSEMGVERGEAPFAI